jgi:hypothetical protein
VIAVILIGIVCAYLGNELCEFSPWCARKLVRWSAFRRCADPGRAQMRADELAAVIDARPGNLLKLITAAGFAGAAVIASARRAGARESAAGAGDEPDLGLSPQMVAVDMSPQLAALVEAHLPAITKLIDAAVLANPDVPFPEGEQVFRDNPREAHRWDALVQVGRMSPRGPGPGFSLPNLAKWAALGRVRDDERRAQSGNGQPANLADGRPGETQS